MSPRGANGLASLTGVATTRKRSQWVAAALLAAALALATWIALQLPNGYLAPTLYAIPMLFAARRFPPRWTMIVGVAALLLYLGSARAQPPPWSVTLTSLCGLIGVAGLATELARQRERAADRAAVAEAAHLESAHILESISDAFYALDVRQRFTYINRRAETLLGTPREEVLGRQVWDVIPAARGTVVEREIQYALQARVTRRIEVHAKDLGRWFDIRIYPAADGVTAYVDDVTERHVAEDAQRDAEAARAATTRRVQFLAEISRELATVEPDNPTMLQRMADLAVPTLADWCIVYLVDPVQGFKRVAVARSDPAQRPLVASLRDIPVPELVQALLTRLTTARGPYLGSAADWTSLRSHLAPGADPLVDAIRPTSFVAMGLVARDRVLGAIIWIRQEGTPDYEPTDITFLEEVGRRCALSVDNARLYQEAREAVRAREDFLSVAAHELRTPLTSVKGYAQLLERRLAVEQPDISALRAAMTKLRPQLARFEQIVRDLLDVSRIDEGRLALRLERCDLAVLAREVFDAIEHSEEHDPLQRMRLVAPASVVGVWDPMRLTQILANLLSNALKYSAGHGEITMEVRQEGDEAIVTVRDEGIGMTETEQGRVFDPFFRSQLIAGRIPGSGLGLHIAKRIAELHGGRISVVSAPNAGSTFTVRLPRSLSLPPSEPPHDAR
ncbi:MAG: ATP-binding protein [Sphaerobacter sp.]|nr:ATP-binding protein [Sphaerobacter sp.]